MHVSFARMGLAFSIQAGRQGDMVVALFCGHHCEPPAPLPLSLGPRACTGGVTLTMAVIFMLGILATKAEPALNVLGETVEVSELMDWAKPVHANQTD